MTPEEAKILRDDHPEADILLTVVDYQSGGRRSSSTGRPACFDDERLDEAEEIRLIR